MRTKMDMQLSCELTTDADRKRFRGAIRALLLQLGGRLIDDDEIYRQVYQIDTAAGIMTANIPYETNSSWLGSVFCHFQYPNLAEAIGGPISETGWKNYHYSADYSVDEAIHHFANGIRPMATTMPE
jgi:hypothetical protein